jgi:hypothetical protein
MHSAKPTRTTRLAGSGSARSTKRSLRPITAVPVLTKALDTLDPALKKHRCTALADLATGLIQLREVEEGCQRASQSLTLAAELRHGVSIDRIRKLERQLPPSHRSPAVRQLREQLGAVA